MGEVQKPPPNFTGWAILLVVVALGIIVFACGHASKSTNTASTSTTAAVVTASPTSTGVADSPKDNNFIRALEIGKVPYADRTDAVIEGNAVCVYLTPANGGTYFGATQGVREHNPNFADEQVGFFVGAAVQIFCPEQRSLIPGG